MLECFVVEQKWNKKQRIDSQEVHSIGAPTRYAYPVCWANVTLDGSARPVLTAFVCLTFLSAAAPPYCGALRRGLRSVAR